MRNSIFISVTFFIAASTVGIQESRARDIETNGVSMVGAPEWMTTPRVDKVIDHVQNVLEWSIRKVRVTWYTDQASFEKSHGLGPVAIAVTRKSDQSVHLGPKIGKDNFDSVFGHELVHVVFSQKHKAAIPVWLEEGLANFIGKEGTVDYNWLAKQPFPEDVRKLVHPYAGSVDQIHYHYKASQALAEMIAAKCELTNLLRLSVGKDMETYLRNFCEISDLNADFKKWVLKKAGAPSK